MSIHQLLHCTLPSNDKQISGQQRDGVALCPDPIFLWVWLKIGPGTHCLRMRLIKT